MVREVFADTSDSVYERIDHLCDEFEAALNRGASPSISGFLPRADEADRSTLFFELLSIDLEDQRKAGGTVTPDSYLGAYPLYADEIAQVFKKIEPATLVKSVGGTVQLRILQSGMRIAHFELRERLGSGAMGEVWQAWDEKLHRDVALKLPRANTLTSSELHRFLREGRAAAQLRHPSIAAIYETGFDGAVAYIASDLVPGESLREYIETKAVDFRKVADICANIAEALHHAHQQGVVHRDLKPANIIIGAADKPYVIDFGLAKLAGEDAGLTSDGELLGTLAYMSPEQARGDAAHVNQATDTYALGAVMFEMLTGGCPFTGDRGAIIHQILNCPPRSLRRLNRRIPRDLETICLKALSKEPQRRYASMQEMAVDLRRYLRGESILARRPTAMERGWRVVHRHPVASAVTLLLCVVATVVGAKIETLTAANFRLQGYRSVLIDTNPPGARVVIVPLDQQTGEPTLDLNSIIRPRGVTPLTATMKPGKYLIEAGVPGSDGTEDFAEVYATVTESGSDLPLAKKDKLSRGLPEDVTRIPFDIVPTKQACADMVVVPVDDVQRQRNPLLPKTLFVDFDETRPSQLKLNDGDGNSPTGNAKHLTFEDALKASGKRFKRLPSASEYDLLTALVRSDATLKDINGRDSTLRNLDGGLVEWTTTKYSINAAGLGSSIQGAHILKGFRDPGAFTALRRSPDGYLVAQPTQKSKSIGFRGVRSGAPRFLDQ